VRTVGVVVLDIDPEDLLEVAAPDDQQPVQALGPHRPDPALGAVRTEDVVEGAGELRIPKAR
jgi:hypothetical protein